MSFKKKEECEFYNFMRNQSNDDSTYLVMKETVKMISSSIVYFQVKHYLDKLLENFDLLSCKVFVYNSGIFRILIEEIEEKRYKNKTNIGHNLVSDLNIKLDIENDRIIIQSSDSTFFNEVINNDKTDLLSRTLNNSNLTNHYMLIVNFDNFLINYYINSNLISSLNKVKCLSSPKDLTYNSLDLTLYKTPHVYGLPERLSDLQLKDDSYRLFNLDFFNQIAGDPQSLYGSIPMLHGVSTNTISNTNVLATFFLNNSSDTWVDILTDGEDKRVTFTTEGGVLDCYLMSDSDDKFYRNFYKVSELTGFAPLPGLFTLGYHQCRWGYLTQEDVTEVDQKMNEHCIPYDVMWLDIDHTDDKRYFTWDMLNFPTMKQYIFSLKSQGRKLVTIIDPHIKANEDYSVANVLLQNNCLVTLSKTEQFIGYCWSGDSYYADFINYDKITPIYQSLFKNEDYF